MTWAFVVSLVSGDDRYDPSELEDTESRLLSKMEYKVAARSNSCSTSQPEAETIPELTGAQTSLYWVTVLCGEAMALKVHG